ncbi:MAG: extracellular solute-binding protein [Solirubrobacteraceae bacterium]
MSLALVLAGCGSQSSSSTGSTSSTSGAGTTGAAKPAAAKASGTLIVFGAGTLANPWAQEFAAFKQLRPGVTIHSEFSASGDRVKAITQLHEPADVLGVADYSLIPKLMFGSGGAKRYANWYVGFVSNQITFAYTAKSKGASQLTSANWYHVLAQPGVKIARSSPAADPSGYQVLQMLKLSEGYYHDPSLSASVLRNSPPSLVAETETSQIAALQSGQIDYLGIYRSDALQNHFRYIHLPPQVNLSDPALAGQYAKVHTQGATGSSVAAKPIIYGLTIPTNAPNKALAQQFVAFLLGPKGQAIMARNGFVVDNPALASSQSALPPALRPLTRSWTGLGS